MLEFSVTILGSGSAVPVFGRHQTAQLVKHSNSIFLVDSGEGVQSRLFELNIQYQKINHIFISHLHGDHFFGLIGLISTMHLQGRSKKLRVYGPPGLEEILLIQFRHSGTVLRFELEFVPVTNKEEPNRIMENSDLEVYSVPMNHGIDCFGYWFMEKLKPRSIRKEAIPENIELHQYEELRQGKDIIIEGRKYANAELTIEPRQPRSYVFCSDNRITESQKIWLKGVDVIYHEATFLEERVDKARQTLHSTAREVGQFADLIGTKKLIIGHFSARYKNLSSILVETKQEFENTFLAEEGKVFEI